MQPGAAEAPAEEGGSAEQVVMDISRSIQGVAEALKQVDPKAAEAMAQLNQQFQSIISGLGKGQAGPSAPGAAGSPEAGGAQGAVPAGMMR